MLDIGIQVGRTGAADARRGAPEARQGGRHGGARHAAQRRRMRRKDVRKGDTVFVRPTAPETIPELSPRGALKAAPDSSLQVPQALPVCGAVATKDEDGAVIRCTGASPRAAGGEEDPPLRQPPRDGHRGLGDKRPQLVATGTRGTFGPVHGITKRSSSPRAHGRQERGQPGVPGAAPRAPPAPLPLRAGHHHVGDTAKALAEAFRRRAGSSPRRWRTSPASGRGPRHGPRSSTPSSRSRRTGGHPRPAQRRGLPRPAPGGHGGPFVGKTVVLTAR